ncbi:MAG: Acyl-CoA synthetase, AMP-(fatty) acid ligase [Chlamydiales bacterium]|jgi:acyl-coenzyme A synthetase/AMP-(fatty) acid ligase|nr:Acyl-CoA synthetase, AMP-(fatty) acid ligase [Chlamydiales bacterium]
MSYQNYIPFHRLLVEIDIEKIPFFNHRSLERKSSSFKINYSAIHAFIKYIREANASRIFILSEDRCFLLTVILAALQLDKEVYLPHTSAPNLLKELLQETDLLLTDQDSFVTALDINLTEVSTTFKVLDPDLAKITFYTSGSTGKPKAITKTLIQLETEVTTLFNLWGKHSFNFLSTVPPYHIYGFLFSLLWPICSGQGLFQFTFSNWEEVCQHLNTQSVLISSPSYLSRIPPYIREEETTKPALIFSSGALLSFSAAQMSEKSFGSLPIEVYGSTETGGIAYRQQINETTPWQAFSNIEIALGVDECLKIKSPYLDVPDFLQTEDRIQLLDTKKFNLLGRQDRIVKIEGKRISLIEIETRLLVQGTLKEVIALPIQWSYREEVGIIAILSEEGEGIIKASGRPQFIEHLKGYLRLYFDPILIPRKWRFVSHIPVNSQGKYLYSDLKLHFQ